MTFGQKQETAQSTRNMLGLDRALKCVRETIFQSVLSDSSQKERWVTHLDETQWMKQWLWPSWGYVSVAVDGTQFLYVGKRGFFIYITYFYTVFIDFLFNFNWLVVFLLLNSLVKMWFCVYMLRFSILILLTYF